MVNGSCAVTSADTMSAGSITQSIPPGTPAIGCGRNGLGNTIDATADDAADCCDRKCGLNPIPMSSTATTTELLLGLAAVVFGLSVLSIGGGGFAVHSVPTARMVATKISTARHCVNLPSASLRAGSRP